jgi:hypothetical protein
VNGAGNGRLTRPGNYAPVTTPAPQRFDPVFFPGLEADEAWPPPCFDFAASWLNDPDLAFERGISGEIVFVRRCDALRLVLDIETAHTALDIKPRSRDFLLLRLMPSALRFTQAISPGAPVPPPLLGGPMVPPAEHHLYAATTTLVGALERSGGETGAALLEALRRTDPGPAMFEMAAARCVAENGFGLEQVGVLARSLQRLAQAHAEVLAAHAIQPDYEGMERMVASAARVQLLGGRWTRDLLAHALQQLESVITTPRLTAETLMRSATEVMEKQFYIGQSTELVEQQARLRDRLMDLAMFWQRTAAAWASVHPETADRRDLDALARNALRRLQLASLYRP